MTNIIVVFSKIEDAKSVKNILVKNGMNVTAVCTSGAQALHYADEFHEGIVISGYRFADMICMEWRPGKYSRHDVTECTKTQEKTQRKTFRSQSGGSSSNCKGKSTFNGTEPYDRGGGTSVRTKT